MREQSISFDDAAREDSAGLAPPIQTVIGFLHRYRLTTLAQISLEILRPLAPVAAMLLLIVQPTLSLYLPGAGINRFSNLLEDPNSYNSFISNLNREGS